MADQDRNPRAEALIIIIAFAVIVGGGIWLYNNQATVAKFFSYFKSTSAASISDSPTSNMPVQPAPTSAATPTPTLESSPTDIQTTECVNDKSTATPPPIPPFKWNSTGLITLWFDDAWSSTYDTAYPLMKKNGLVGAISVPVKFVCYKAFMTWKEIRTMQENGWETTSHSWSHYCDLSKYTNDTIHREIVESKEVLQQHGLRADNFVMPCGYSRADILAAFVGNHPPIIETVQKYYKSYRTTISTRNNAIPLQDPYNLKALVIQYDMDNQTIQKAIDEAIKQKGWLILVFHQIDNSANTYSITADRLQEILDMVKKSGLPVVLPSQAIDIH